MDNAAKAVIMVGGVLISLAVIALAVSTYKNASGMATGMEEAMSATQISSFNRFYTSYMTPTSEIRCIDALNVLNRAVEDEVEPIVNAPSYITKSGDYYVADSKHYTTGGFKYKITYLNSVGIVKSITIEKT